MNVKFNKYHVAANGLKARCWYSLDNRTDGRKCVTIYARDYTGTLGEIFADSYKNDTDSSTDYFEKGRVALFEDSPHYAAARARAEAIIAERTAKCGLGNRLAA